MDVNYQSYLFHNRILIAGPCALEDRAQLKNTIGHIASMGVKMVRACLWKPRTTPGWDGVGTDGIHYLLEETLPLGLIPATEIITAQHAQIALDALKDFGEDGKIILWIGSRNQNHFEQQAIGKILADSSANVILMFKNQMWEDKRHWIGIYEHIVNSGYPKERLIACHRGFAPGRDSNPEGLRNIPNYEMAMDLKELTQVPMILDPSHIGGAHQKILNIIRTSHDYSFDGFMIEVHENVKAAKTDANQQMSIDEFYNLTEELRLRDKENCPTLSKQVA